MRRFTASLLLASLLAFMVTDLTLASSVTDAQSSQVQSSTVYPHRGSGRVEV
jgi:hypothetical protein